MKRILLLLFFLILMVNPVHGYYYILKENQTGEMNTVLIRSDTCLEYLEPCRHQYYLNNFYQGYFTQGDLLQFSDGGEGYVILDEKINTDLQDVYGTTKSGFTLALMAFIQPIFYILVVFVLVMYVLRDFKKRGKRK